MRERAGPEPTASGPLPAPGLGADEALSLLVPPQVPSPLRGPSVPRGPREALISEGTKNVDIFSPLGMGPFLGGSLNSQTSPAPAAAAVQGDAAAGSGHVAPARCLSIAPGGSPPASVRLCLRGMATPPMCRRCALASL